MLQAMAVAKAQSEVKKEVVKKVIKKADKKALMTAYDRVLSKYEKQGIRDIFDLEAKLASDKKFRKDFFTDLGAELKKMGFSGSEEKLGKIAFKNIRRDIRLRDRRLLMAEALTGKRSEEAIMQMNNLLDSVTGRFGMSLDKFYHKYTTDAKFRRLVNMELRKAIMSDPNLANSPMAKMSETEIMQNLVSIKVSGMSRTEKMKLFAKASARRMPMEMLKTYGGMAAMTAQYMVIMPTAIVMSSIPQLSSMSLYTLYGVQQQAGIFMQTMASFRRLGNTTDLNLLAQYGSIDALKRKMMEESAIQPM